MTMVIVAVGTAGNDSLTQSLNSLPRMQGRR
jgi:hypothetical protein